MPNRDAHSVDDQRNSNHGYILLSQMQPVYEAMQEQHPDNQAGSFKCKECNAEVHTWSGVYDFSAGKPKR